MRPKSGEFRSIMRTNYERFPVSCDARPDARTPDRGPAARIADHAGDGRRVFVVRLAADLRVADAADGAHGSKPARLAAAPAHSKRSESARARDARYARHE